VCFQVVIVGRPSAGRGLAQRHIGRSNRAPARWEDETLEIDRRAGALAQDYLEQEALHRDPDAAANAAPGVPSRRIELF